MTGFPRDFQSKRMSGRAQIILTWIAWTVWTVVVTLKIFSTVGKIPTTMSTLYQYVDFINTFWAKQPLYIPNDLRGFHYLPIMLILGTPLTWVKIQVAGAIFELFSVGFFTFSVWRIAQQLARFSPALIAGIILLASLMPMLVQMEFIQLQISMIAAMTCATAAGMRSDWRSFVIWLALAVALKPLSIVMLLLAAVTLPKTRVVLIASVVALVVVPFAFQDGTYLINEYANYIHQLSYITDAKAGDWETQADISTFLLAVGFNPSPLARLTLRLVAAFGTLVMVWRIAQLRIDRATSFALLIFSTSYIALFNPKQEIFSFLVVVPGVAALGLTYLGRNIADWRGWVWIGLAVAAGVRWGIKGVWLLPSIMIVIWIGLIILTLNPRRWCDLLSAKPVDAHR